MRMYVDYAHGEDSGRVYCGVECEFLYYARTHATTYMTQCEQATCKSGWGVARRWAPVLPCFQDAHITLSCNECILDLSHSKLFCRLHLRLQRALALALLRIANKSIEILHVKAMVAARTACNVFGRWFKWDLTVRLAPEFAVPVASLEAR